MTLETFNLSRSNGAPEMPGMLLVERAREVAAARGDDLSEVIGQGQQKYLVDNVHEISRTVLAKYISDNGDEG